jgi:hypothetical protein
VHYQQDCLSQTDCGSLTDGTPNRPLLLLR